MKIIIALGNPGKEYENTRHNAGFLAGDFLQTTFTFEPFQENKKMFSLISEGKIGNEKVFIAKPTTFMNESGKTALALMQFYKLSPQDILLLHDELDIAPGAYKVATSSRAAGHNGVQDIFDTLGTQDITRIRLGIGHPTEVLGVCIPHHDYVLQKFSKEESEKLTSLFPQVQKEVEQWILNTT
ncbi:MAG: aminoacyl-tRNA hydrolase [Patescibacteria group bacterium]